MNQVREAGLTELDPFLRGLDQDHDAAVAGLTLAYSNGPIEGVTTKDEADQATNVWPGQLPATPKPDPAGIAGSPPEVSQSPINGGSDPGRS
jgi:hypothetical protein